MIKAGFALNQLKRCCHKSHGTVPDAMFFVWRNAGKVIHLKFLHASIITPRGRVFPVSLSRAVKHSWSSPEIPDGKK
jgi:hypothetical protein